MTPSHSRSSSPIAPPASFVASVIAWLTTSVLAALLMIFGCLGVFTTKALAQNPVPFVNQPLVPDATAPGGPEFTLTVNGTGFVAGALVYWNSFPIPTRFVTGSQLTATVPAADIATAGTASVTVVNPAPGGGRSGTASDGTVTSFSVTTPTASVSFAPAITLAGASPQSVAVGDLNNDGNLDLAFTNTSTDTVSIFLGDGTGNFTLTSSPATGSNPVTVVTGDFNGDGNLDLAVANHDDNTVSILLGDGTGQFILAASLVTGSPGSEAVADFNGDGNLDLAIDNDGEGYDTVSVFIGDSTGNFTLVSSTATGLSWHTIAVGDFNRDGKLDLAVTNWGSGDVSILLGDGTGHFTAAPSPSTGGSPPALVPGDFNNDGKLDLAAVNCGPGTVPILLGDGAGNFSVFSTPSVNDSCSLDVVAGDFNGDSNLDLVASGDSGTASVLLGDGTGNFSLAATPAAGLQEEQIMVGDFNNDGRLDVVVTSFGSGTVSVLLQAPTPGVGLAPTSLSFAAQLISTSSALQNVTLTNTGSSSLSITNIAASGDFAQTNTCGSTVAAGASCTISVTFTPTGAGARAGALTITDDAAGSPQTVSLTGTGLVSGTAPNATLSATNLTFASQLVGSTSTPQSVTLSNYGGAALSITGIAASGDFAQTNTCGNSLASGASCAISVTFSPTQAGTRTGSVTVTDNAPGSPQSVLLTGEGVTAAQSYDVAADFERGWTSHSNPNGVWSYGYSSGFAGPITLYDQTVQPGLDGVGQLWLSSSVDIGYSPGAFFNDGPAFDDGNINFLADEFVLVAGIGGQYSDLVFTAPADGVYSIASEFRGAQYTIGTVVGVVANGNVLFSSSVTSVGQLVPFNTTVSLKAGNTLVFSVGPGGGSQNTGLSATITGPTAAENSLGFGYYRFENGTPGQVASGSNSVLDSSPYDDNGTPLGAPTYSSDTPSVGIPNSASLQFHGSDSVTFTKAFPFNQPGLDASLDFWLKISPTNLHEFIFWTRLDTSDTNRFNVYVNYNGQLALDYRDPDGNVHYLVGAWYDGVPIPTDTWTHFNITRLGNEYFILENGTLMATAIDTSPNLPTDVGWMMAAGQYFGGLNGFQGLIDEVQVSPALSSIVLTGYTVAFGDQLLGTTSGAQSVTLTNLGSAPANITNIGVNGDFAQTNTCGNTVASGASCTISITFTPTALGTRTGTITINDDASGSPQVVQLTGIAQEVSVSPASLTFKGQNVDTTSTGQFVTVTNHGSAAVSLTGVTTTGDFEATKPCPSLPPRGTCKVLVLFRPTQTGLRTGVLTINDSEPSQATVALSGTGTEPSVSMSAGSLSFAGQAVNSSSAAQSVTLTNTGSGPLTITGVTTSGDYAATAGHCAGTVAAGASCEITVLFKPLLAGNRTGSLSIADTATGSPQTVALSGTGEDFTLSARTMSATVTAGQTASYTLSLASEDGFSGIVSLTCTGAPATAACSLSPSAVTLAASDATLVTVGVTTTARAMVPPASRHRLPGPGSPGVWLLLVLLTTLAMLARAGRGLATPKRTLVWAPLGLALLLVALWTGCGSSGGGTSAPPHVTGTPAGTYTITVAASESGLTTNVTLTLVVN